jgi:hypothetical protein
LTELSKQHYLLNHVFEVISGFLLECREFDECINVQINTTLVLTRA